MFLVEYLLLKRLAREKQKVEIDWDNTRTAILPLNEPLSHWDLGGSRTEATKGPLIFFRQVCEHNLVWRAFQVCLSLFSLSCVKAESHQGQCEAAPPVALATCSSSSGFFFTLLVCKHVNYQRKKRLTVVCKKRECLLMSFAFLFRRVHQSSVRVRWELRGGSVQVFVRWPTGTSEQPEDVLWAGLLQNHQLILVNTELPLSPFAPALLKIA